MLGWAHDDRYLGIQRLIALEQFVEINNRKRAEFVAGQDIFDVMAHLYDQEYKYERRHKRPFVLWEPDEHDAFFELLGGTYPDDKSLKYIAGGYRDVFEPETLPTSSTSYLTFLKGHMLGPSWITRHALQETVGNRNEPTIFIFDPQNSEDLVDGWNHRLVQSNFLPVNVHWLSDHAEVLREQIRAYHQADTRQSIRNDVPYERRIRTFRQCQSNKGTSHSSFFRIAAEFLFTQRLSPHVGSANGTVCFSRSPDSGNCQISILRRGDRHRRVRSRFHTCIGFSQRRQIAYLFHMDKCNSTKRQLSEG